MDWSTQPRERRHLAASRKVSAVPTGTGTRSSAESVGEFWFGEAAEVVKQSQFGDFCSADAVGLSGYQFHFVIEPSNRAAGTAS